MAKTAGYYHSGVTLNLDTWSEIDRAAIPQGMTRHGFIVAAIRKALEDANNPPSDEGGHGCMT